MKIILSFTLLFFSSIGMYAQESSLEATAKVPFSETSKFYEPSYYESLLFPNQNLSVNSAPQNEPSVRISRVNPNIVVAAWRDFRLGFTNPIIRRIGYSYSTNGGLTWSVSQLLPDPNPNGHVSQSDPVVTSDAQGNFYISSTSRKTNMPGQENRDQLVYKSTNNGQTFVEYSIGIAGTGGGGEDKEWMICDLVNSNPTYNNLMMTSTAVNLGFIRFAKSTDGGLIWSTPVNITSGGTGSNLAVGTNGHIYVVWDFLGIRFDKSTNGGVSFGTDFQLSNVTSTNGFPFICCDYSNRSTRGNVYVVWDDMRGGGSDVWFQRSTNGGTNWLSSPVRVNDVTTLNQYWPAIQCDTSGNLYVIYYDTRLGSTQINSWIAYSTDQGTNWVNQRLSDTSFTNSSPNGDVRFGDYIGIDAFSGKVIPVWTDQRSGTPNQEIYTAILGGLISIAPVSGEVPVEFSLHQNYPNPFNPLTKIKFDIPKQSFVKITVFDILGKEIAVIVNQNLNSGSYEADFDASYLTSGIYFYKMEVRQAESLTGEFTDTKKMILVK